MGKIFKSPYLWISLGALLLALLFFFLAPVLGLKAAGYRWLGVSLILLCASFVLLLIKFLRMQKALKSRDTDTSFGAFTENASLASTWLEPLKRETQGGLDILKQSGKAKVKVGQNPLDLFKFYLVLGNQGVGKTSLLEGSGIHFPRKFPSEQELARQTEHFTRWHFSNHGIYLEAPARYLAGGEGDEELQVWLSIMAKEDRQHTLDGIVLCVSMAEMLQPDSQVQRQAAQFRERLALIMTGLHLELPVYLVFTHADLIPGFQDYFEDLRDLEAGQILGATFAVSGTSSPPRVRFEREYKKIWESLSARLNMRLAQNNPEDRKRRIYLFPNEFAAAQEKLALFTEHLFKETLKKEAPLFRGFFFTSILMESNPMQGGAFVDDAGAMAGSQTIMAHPLNPRARSKTPAFQQPEEGSKLRALFTHLLFTGLLKNEPPLARTPAHRQGALSRQAIILSSVFGALSLLVCIYALYGLIAGRTFLSPVADTILEASRIRFGNSFRQDFLVVKDLHAQLLELEEEGSPWSLPPGFGHAGEARDLLRRTFLIQLDRMVARDALRSLQAGVNLASQFHFPGEQSQLYGKLKLYLSLTDQGQANRSKLDADQIAMELAALWNQELQQKRGIGNLPANSETDVESFAHYYARRLAKGRIENVPRANMQTVEAARQAMRGTPSIDGLYNNLVSSYSSDGDLTLAAMGVPENAMLRNMGKVRGFYTKQGFQGEAMELITGGAKDLHRKDWVMGEGVSVSLPTEMQDERQLSRALQDRYYQRYTEEWVQFLGGMRASVPSDLSQASGQVVAYSSSTQGLPAVLARLAAEVELVEKGDGAVAKEAERRLQQNRVARLARDVMSERRDPREELQARFAPVARLVSGPGGGMLGNYFNSLRAVGEVLGQLAGSPDPDRAALEYAQEIFAAKKESALSKSWSEANSALQQVPDDVRQWLQPLLQEPLREVAGMLVRLAEKELEASWQTEVLGYHRENFQGRYPFVRGVSQEVSIEKMVIFFNPTDGKLPQFINSKVAPFVRVSEGNYLAKDWNGVRIRLRQDALRTLGQGMRLSSRMFLENSRSYRPYPITLSISESRNTAGVAFGMMGKEIQVKPGGGTVQHQYRWPGDNLFDGAYVQAALVGGGTEGKKVEGPWGVLKLLDNARDFAVRDGGFRVSWRFRVSGKYDVDVQMEGRIQEAVNPFTFKDYYVFDCANSFIDDAAVTMGRQSTASYSQN